MPEVKQVIPPKPTTTKAVAKSILSEAVDVGSIKSPWIKITIYGPNRVGKTTLACKFPKPLLLLGFEPNETGGSKSVENVKGVKFIRMTTLEKTMLLGQELKALGAAIPFKAVVIDSATSLQDIVLKEILNLPAIPDMLRWGDASLKEYQLRSERVRHALRPFIDLPCHTVINAKEKDHNPPKEGKPEIVQGIQMESFFSVNLGGETAGWLQDACDSICQLNIHKELREVPVKNPDGTAGVRYTETGNHIRRLRTQYHPNYMAGLRSSTPDKVPSFIDNPDFSKLKAVIDGE